MNHMTAKEVALASQKVAEKAFKIFDWSAVRSVLSYVPLPESGEIDPCYIADRLGDGAAVDYVVPSKDAAFPGGAYDVIIVPVLGFNPQGYRLGRGGGWYDRMLALHPEAALIGLAHHWSKIEFEPEAHDVRLNLVITDETATN